MNSVLKSICKTTIKDTLNPMPALMYLVGIAAQWAAYFMFSSPEFFKGDALPVNPFPFDLYWPTVIGTSILFLVACSKSYFTILIAIIASLVLAALGHLIEGLVIVVLIHVAIIFTFPLKNA